MIQIYDDYFEQLLKRIYDEAANRGCDSADLVVNNQLVSELVDRIVAAQKTYQLSVDYGLSVEQMLANGGYGSFDHDVTNEHFPHQLKGKTSVVAKLIKFKISDDAAHGHILDILRKQRLRPATLAELLTFGATYRDHGFLIAALGSVWTDRSGNRKVACLGRSDSGWDVELYKVFDDGWPSFCYFLAISK